MHFRTFFEEEKPLGFSYKKENFEFVFGNQFCTLSHLKKRYPSIKKFCFLQQTHGDHLVHSSLKTHFFPEEKFQSIKAEDLKRKENSFQDSLPSGDAHWTGEENLFLCIKTADCLPILFADQKGVLALHAGWRGLVKDFILKVIQKKFSSSLPSLSVAIGPHIQKENFEVEADVGKKIANCYKKYFPYIGKAHPVFFPHKNPKKRYVSLKALAYTQLLFSGLKPSQIFLSSEDSFSSPLYASYRKNGKAAGRQISGVFRKFLQNQENEPLELKKQKRV